MVYVATLAISQTTNVSGEAVQQKKELERICKEASVSYFELLPRMYVDGRRETTKSLSVTKFSFQLRSNPNQLVHRVLSVLSFWAGKKFLLTRNFLPLQFPGHSLAA
jgi:hypothetical protein